MNNKTPNKTFVIILCKKNPNVICVQNQVLEIENVDDSISSKSIPVIVFFETFLEFQLRSWVFRE